VVVRRRGAGRPGELVGAADAGVAEPTLDDVAPAGGEVQGVARAEEHAARQRGEERREARGVRAVLSECAEVDVVHARLHHQHILRAKRRVQRAEEVSEVFKQQPVVEPALEVVLGHLAAPPRQRAPRRGAGVGAGAGGTIQWKWSAGATSVAARSVQYLRGWTCADPRSAATSKKSVRCCELPAITSRHPPAAPSRHAETVAGGRARRRQRCGSHTQSSSRCGCAPAQSSAPPSHSRLATHRPRRSSLAPLAPQSGSPASYGCSLAASAPPPCSPTVRKKGLPPMCHPSTSVGSRASSTPDPASSSRTCAARHTLFCRTEEGLPARAGRAPGWGGAQVCLSKVQESRAADVVHENLERRLYLQPPVPTSSQGRDAFLSAPGRDLEPVLPRLRRNEACRVLTDCRTRNMRRTEQCPHNRHRGRRVLAVTLDDVDRDNGWADQARNEPRACCGLSRGVPRMDREFRMSASCGGVQALPNTRAD
jgi:hypothetical protein